MIDFFVALNNCLFWKDDYKTYKTIDGAMLQAVYRLGPYELVHALEEELYLLATAGVTVSLLMFCAGGPGDHFLYYEQKP